jgi:hypothetical protein
MTLNLSSFSFPLFAGASRCMQAGRSRGRTARGRWMVDGRTGRWLMDFASRRLHKMTT